MGTGCEAKEDDSLDIEENFDAENIWTTHAGPRRTRDTTNLPPRLLRWSRTPTWLIHCCLVWHDQDARWKARAEAYTYSKCRDVYA